MQIILLGAPGSGKGTLAQTMQHEKGLTQISTGNLFRKHIKNQTELGRLASDYISKGQLVPDEVTDKLIKNELQQIKADFILDGYPRNLKQAQALDDMLKELSIPLTACVYLQIDQEVIVRRLVNRVVCKDCGATYNLLSAKPKEAGKCDFCGGKVVSREDDNAETIRERFVVYQKETAPLIDYYKQKGKLITVDCNEGEGVLSELKRLYQQLNEGFLK